MVNLSNTPLMEAQESWIPLYLDYITVTETMCHRLNQQDAYGHRAENNRMLKGSYHANLTEVRQKTRLYKSSKGKNQRIILTVDKRVVMVVMDWQNYFNKAGNLIEQPTYRSILTVPTNEYEAKLLSILKRIKRESGHHDKTYRVMYLMGVCSPKFYGLPKIHKKGISLKAHSF